MIPVCTPTLSKKEWEYVKDCLDSNWISSSGKYIKLFEDGFSKYCNTKFGVACSNGTTALHLALESLNIKKGDEVIIPTFTMIATANAIIYTGAKPVFVDSELETWNMDVKKIEEKITKKTKAIMPVHTYGHPVDMDPILKLAKDYNLYVIEDAAEAHGAEYKNKKTGGLADVGCFSFYGNKIISTGEGGMLITNNGEIAEKSKLLRNHAFTIPRFLHKHLGFNYRFTNIQAAIGLAQLENINELVNARIKNANYYTKLLKDVDGIITPPQAKWAKNVYWMYGILIDNKFRLTRDEVMKKLFEKGIETRSFFIPMHKQPIFNDKNNERTYVKDDNKYPNAEELSRKGLYLPSSSSLKKEEIEYIVNTIKSLKK